MSKKEGWQLVWKFGKDFNYMQMGWRVAHVGFIKLKLEELEEGTVLKRGQYDGFLLRWRYWLPYEKY